jgi:hypothetical protein
MSNTLRKPKNPYGSSPRKLLEDKNISLKAKGIYAFMECKIDGWNFTASSMATQLKESRKTILVAMQELKATGWLTYHKNKDGSGVYELIGNYVISPKPENDTMALQSHSPKSARSKNDTVQKKDCINKKDCSNKNDLNNKNKRDIDRFEDFWNVYPKKRNKAGSRDKWKLKNLDSLADQLIADVLLRVTDDKRWVDGFIPDPLTYINQERWNDEVEKIVEQPQPKGTVDGMSNVNKQYLQMKIKQGKQWRLQ